MENAGFLFAAFGVIWVVLFGYIILLFNKQRQLKREIHLLNQIVREKNDY